MILKLINKRDGYVNDYKKKLVMLYILEMIGYVFLIKGYNFYKIIILKFFVIMYI